MEKLKKIRVYPFAKFQAFLMALVGLLAGIYYSFCGLLVDGLVSLGWISNFETPGLGYGTVLAFGALIGMPLIAAAVGFVEGLVEAGLYNWTAKWFGGIKIDFLQYG
jgi:hypothetical protein